MENVNSNILSGLMRSIFCVPIRHLGEQDNVVVQSARSGMIERSFRADIIMKDDALGIRACLVMIGHHSGISSGLIRNK